MGFVQNDPIEINIIIIDMDFLLIPVLSMLKNTISFNKIF
ncbi:hypothetical protein SAMN05421636_11146 [Pricia antarctica]|uniref:Uncharacterized protein n=1 Tax=Pricia antarctica TaxID=641691 RepID=A0A1G7I7Q3_9FLAO|nr:hypothetical protein SAMN05421636_11146 [Pricia antarctica]